MTFEAKTAKCWPSRCWHWVYKETKSVSHYKYLGIVLDIELSDDKDIQRQLRYQYYAANKLLFLDVQTQWKMYFFVPSVRPRMQHNYGVISGRHTSTDCVWPITLVAGLWLYNLPWWAIVGIHQVQCNISTLRPYWEKMCTCFLNDAQTPIMYGWALWCSQNVYISIHSYSLNTKTTFYFVTECPGVTVLGWGRVQATTLSYFNRPWPELDSIS